MNVLFVNMCMGKSPYTSAFCSQKLKSYKDMKKVDTTVKN